ncbi:MAG: MBL fold metallo-hydrolase [Acidobacteriota bacterium]|nr:MBL fold metallo-hydrolase [Acidobacteriota bacterium]
MKSALTNTTIGCAEILFGEDNGKYPDANCVLVAGAEERVLLDTTPGLATRGREAVTPIDRILVTHAHEDHTAGNFLFPEADIHVHIADLPGLQSLEGMIDIFTLDPSQRDRMHHILVDKYNYVERPDAQGFEEGAIFDLGGGVAVEAIHTPGHTRGHCSFLIEPEGLLLLGDVDLSSFGPFYADNWASLEQFEATIEKVARIEVEHYLTSHHVGLVDRDTFLARIQRYLEKIRERDRRLVEYLAEPRTLDDITAHRFVFRPQDQSPTIDLSERAMMTQHVDRQVRRGFVVEVAPGSYQASAAVSA